ncbi:uncharacterized protein [Prorops nasuta]|uniref:uncharacterized protein n=1 Tax=Prorops nasuta TaxID=863751 RepID=UPI0034CF7606
MITKFVELFEKVSTVLLECPTAPNMLSAMELRTITEFIQLLKVFEQSTKIISGENYITASKIIPIINILKQTLKEAEVETKIAKEIKQVLVNELQERFDYVEDSLTLSISTLLDPRFKQIHLFHKNAYTKALTKIVKEICNYDNNDLRENTETPVLKEMISDFIMKILVNVQKSHRNIANNNDVSPELKYYLHEPPIVIDECPIKFWSSRNSTPLGKLALKYLSIIGTSVPSERLFSKGASPPSA